MSRLKDEIPVSLVNCRTCFPCVPAPVYAMRHRVVESSHSLHMESFPEERTYFPFLENSTEQTSAPSCAFLKVATHWLEIPSQIFTLPSMELVAYSWKQAQE